MPYDIVALFSCLDDFCKVYQDLKKHRLINTGVKRHRDNLMSLSEMLCVVLVFHFSPCKNFKRFSLEYLSKLHALEFPNLLNYNRFVQLMPKLFVPFVYYCII